MNTTDLQIVVANNTQEQNAASFNNDLPIVGISPKRLFYGVVSAGFYYNLKFSVQNNSLSPIRIRISCTPFDGEKNSIRVVYLPDKIASGMSVQMTLELTAEFVASSMFTLQISTSADPRIFSRLVEANVISPDTFKYVKKSLTLQKRPIYRSNVTSVGPIQNIPSEGGSIATPVTSFSETLILDDEDIEDLTSLPMVQNVYWDPFSKILRIDPEIGRVAVDKTISLEESIERTTERRRQRGEDLEEQGFYTMNYIQKLREGFPHVNVAFDTEAEEGTVQTQDSVTLQGVEDNAENQPLGSPGTEEDGFLSSRMSVGSHRTSVSSLMAMKREKIEKLRRATISAANSFSENTKKDSMVNSMRTLNMIQGRQNQSPVKRAAPS